MGEKVSEKLGEKVGEKTGEKVGEFGRDSQTKPLPVFFTRPSA